MTNSLERRRISVLPVNQWREEWDSVHWDTEAYRRKPAVKFYMFSMKAKDLIALSNVHQRKIDGHTHRSDDLGIQRAHNKKRSEKIKKFVKYGYPYCDFSENAQNRNESESIKKPGWLPTGIVVNLMQTPKREGLTVEPCDQVEIQENSDGTCDFLFPEGYSDEWSAKEQCPIEIIDGQHRLFAFEESEMAKDFEFPVIAFVDLDVSWQAYIFWSINVSPEKINPSLAFDMYPLLRTEDWLKDDPSIHKVYREARAQEITEMLWAYPESPWYQKINMLGEPGVKFVRQTAWVRTIVSAFMKTNFGLFESLGKKHIVPWNRVQQAAFLIKIGMEFKRSIESQAADDLCHWAFLLNGGDLAGDIGAQAMNGTNTLLNMDQGVRGLCLVLNSYFATVDNFNLLLGWRYELDHNDYLRNIEECIKSLNGYSFEDNSGMTLNQHIVKIADALASFDWRSAAADQLTEADSMKKRAYKGSGGYVALRDDILTFLKDEFQIILDY